MPQFYGPQMRTVLKPDFILHYSVVNTQQVAHIHIVRNSATSWNVQKCKHLFWFLSITQNWNADL